jgi:succinoglycan biosynthesis transport protein ExoP
MLQSSNNEHLISSGHVERQQSESLVAFLDLAIGFLRRQYWVILLPLLVTMTLGVFYVMKTPPSFMATASMMIDPMAKTGGLRSLEAALNDTPVDGAWIESQISVLKSRVIASSVIRELHLTEDPEFVGQSEFHKIATAIRQRFWHGGETRKLKSDADLARQAISAFLQKLDVQRVGGYVIEIDFTSQAPDRAMQIANAVVDAYLKGQLNAKYQASQRASDWLQQRLQVLHEQATAAEQAVVEFKTKNKLVASEGKQWEGSGSPILLVHEQQMAELSGQLLTARKQTGEAQAKLSRIEAILRDEFAENVNATVSDSLNNPITSGLRSKYLELVNREANWSQRYGRDHSAVVNIRTQLKEIRSSMRDELERIAESYKSTYAIAKRAQEDLEKRWTEAVAEWQGANQGSVVSLRGLESSAQSYRSLYDNLLQRYTESIQQQSFPVAEFRLISSADDAVKKSGSRALMALAVALVGGIGCGTGLALLRELLDRVFRTSGQIQSILDAECLALVPSTQDVQRNSTSLPAPMTIGKEIDPFRVVVDSPVSQFAEAIHTIKFAADRAGDVRKSKVIAFTSALPGEGKTTIAAALAQVIAQIGRTVVLVDCDLRNPTLSRRLAPRASCGFVDVVSGTKSLEASIWKDPGTGLAFLPAGSVKGLVYIAEILGSDAARNLFDKLRESYQYVIVDLSPLAPVVDARATTQLVDAYVMIVKWGSTKIDVVRHGLSMAPGVQQNLLGVVLNQTDFTRLKSYDEKRATYCYNKQFARYGYTK